MVLNQWFWRRAFLLGRVTAGGWPCAIRLGNDGLNAESAHFVFQRLVKKSGQLLIFRPGCWHRDLKSIRVTVTFARHTVVLKPKKW